MIGEDYVSFEIAKLLKEKGFDWLTFTTYDEDGRVRCALRPYLVDTDLPHSTIQMAMKWLREVHNLLCQVGYDFILGWYCQVTSLKETVWVIDDEEMKIYHPDQDNGFGSYEEACESAIKYCLENLI